MKRFRLLSIVIAAYHDPPAVRADIQDRLTAEVARMTGIEIAETLLAMTGIAGSVLASYARAVGVEPRAQLQVSRVALAECAGGVVARGGTLRQ